MFYLSKTDFAKEDKKAFCNSILFKEQSSISLMVG